jgi:hypothetical protein
VSRELKSINELYNTREVSISYDVVDVLVGYEAFHHLHFLIITIFSCQSDLSKAKGMDSYKVDVPSHYQHIM